MPRDPRIDDLTRALQLRGVALLREDLASALADQGLSLASKPQSTDAQRLRDALFLLELVRDTGFLPANSSLWHDCDRMVRNHPRKPAAVAAVAAVAHLKVVKP